MAHQEPEKADKADDMKEGLRLIKAFMRVKNPDHRQKLLELAEQFAREEYE